MKIEKIKILDYKTCLELENDNYADEIMEEFISRNGFNVDDIFDFREKIYVTKEIALRIEDQKCVVLVYAEFLNFKKDL